MQIDDSHRSPNHSSREGRAIGLLILHSTVGSLASSLSWLCNPASKVSAHYVVAKDGRVFRLVPDDLAAWHAGQSYWPGWPDVPVAARSEEVMWRSIGIELENLNGMEIRDPTTKKLIRIVRGDPYPVIQLAAATTLVRSLLSAYHLTPDLVTSHGVVARPPGRKRDPIEFPWETWHATL